MIKQQNTILFIYKNPTPDSVVTRVVNGVKMECIDFERFTQKTVNGILNQYRKLVKEEGTGGLMKIFLKEYAAADLIQINRTTPSGESTETLATFSAEEFLTQIGAEDFYNEMREGKQKKQAIDEYIALHDCCDFCDKCFDCPHSMGGDGTNPKPEENSIPDCASGDKRRAPHYDCETIGEYLESLREDEERWERVERRLAAVKEGRYRVEETSDAFADSYIITDIRTGLYYTVDGSCRTFENYDEAEEYAAVLNRSQNSDVEEALMLIKAYQEREFECEWERPEDLSDIELAYTEFTDGGGRVYEVEVSADLEKARVKIRVGYPGGSEVFYIEPYLSLKDLIRDFRYLDFNTLVSAPESVLDRLRTREQMRVAAEGLLYRMKRG